MHKKALRAILLIFYVWLMVSEINNNEFEEAFNENVSADFYTDFDDDGQFDFESEDEEETSEIGLKMSHAPLALLRSNDILLPVPSMMDTSYRAIFPQEYLKRIFMPPKA